MLHINTSHIRRTGYLLIAIVTYAIGASGSPVMAASAQNKQVQPLQQRPSHQACVDVAPNRARCLADISIAGVSDPLKASPIIPSGAYGYGPAEFHTAYQLPCTPGGPIAAICSTPSTYGPQTIAIVDAGGYSSSSGSLEADLQTYNSYYGLPACTAANGCLTIVNQSGATSPLPPNISSGWSSEIALDVQVAHTVCQTCKIVLVEANDDMINNLAAAEVTAASFNPVAISNSWGSSTDLSSYDSSFIHNGIAVVVATGDNSTATNGQSWPSDIPNVVAVSGTTLQINTDKTWASETVWSGSGGGCSVTYSAPSWQTARSDWAANGCSAGGRAFGDISADADPSTGAAIYVNGAWFSAGGTSLATPLIAAMYALADNLPATAVAPNVLYQNTSAINTHDVTSGTDCTGTGQSYCTAKVGFDTPSGLGTPNGLGLFQADPAPPYNLSADLIGQTELDLSWSAGSSINGVANYQIYRNGSLLTSVAATNYADTGLTANTVYNYYLTATDTKANVSAPSQTLASGTFLGPDINQDGHINLLDFSLLASKYGQSGSALGRSDINHDNSVNLLDFSLLASKYGTE